MASADRETRSIEVGSNDAKDGATLEPAKVALVLGLVAFLAFAPGLGNEFVAMDDITNFLNNRDFRGVGWSNIQWAWTTMLLGVYQPTAWMLLEVQYLFTGLNPYGYHSHQQLVACPERGGAFLFDPRPDPAMPARPGSRGRVEALAGDGTVGRPLRRPPDADRGRGLGVGPALPARRALRHAERAGVPPGESGGSLGGPLAMAGRVVLALRGGRAFEGVRHPVAGGVPRPRRLPPPQARGRSRLVELAGSPRGRREAPFVRPLRCVHGRGGAGQGHPCRKLRRDRRHGLVVPDRDRLLLGDVLPARVALAVRPERLLLPVTPDRPLRASVPACDRRHDRGHGADGPASEGAIRGCSRPGRPT